MILKNYVECKTHLNFINFVVLIFYVITQKEMFCIVVQVVF